jgi:uncharacterized membrane-anchored protein
MRRWLFWPFVALQVAVPAAVAGMRARDVASAQHVLLRVEPVDPRDPFRGQYVALSYEISALPHNGGEGDAAYVRLHRNSSAWTGVSAGTHEPPARDRPYIRGRIEDGRLVFGIERFYTSEDAAPRYGDALAQHRLYADVALGRGGRATLTRLVIRDS